MVDLEVHVEGFGQVRGLDQRGDAALDRHVAAQEVGRLLGDPGRVGREAAGRVLGRQDRDVELLLQLHVVVDVVLGQRVLVPVVAELLDRQPDAQRLG